ncbi:hypothetical protein EXIGLDRAFT_28516 [Exidia glandulosa HHB12029]|uniref:Uncharacterized protein n=1 Tax=Exidia glandulosa HHB12029 TaxID=1314781 RepID=A0A165P9Q1_EXIGL|nr:hypothetical protein EXIGLDRAFT_28516 [Exidia glandulosa HHB12029]
MFNLQSWACLVEILIHTPRAPLLRSFGCRIADDAHGGQVSTSARSTGRHTVFALAAPNLQYATKRLTILWVAPFSCGYNLSDFSMVELYLSEVEVTELQRSYFRRGLENGSPAPGQVFVRLDVVTKRPLFDPTFRLQLEQQHLDKLYAWLTFVPEETQGSYARIFDGVHIRRIVDPSQAEVGSEASADRSFTLGHCKEIHSASLSSE